MTIISNKRFNILLISLISMIKSNLSFTEGDKKTLYLQNNIGITIKEVLEVYGYILPE